MASVNIAELRSHLSLYLNRANRGEEILVRDRNLAIARIVPLAETGEFDNELLQMAAEGLVRLPRKKLDKAFFKLPAPRISLKKLKAAVEADREED
jgi:prevent-host-death family protein